LSISAGWPKRCTGIMAFVREVMLFSTLSGSRQNISDCISANTGIALCINAHVAVDVNEYGGTITSSPGLTPTATTAACKAEVAELKAKLAMSQTGSSDDIFRKEQDVRRREQEVISQRFFYS